jgi:hypothetical protein
MLQIGIDLLFMALLYPRILRIRPSSPSGIANPLEGGGDEQATERLLKTVSYCK